MPTGIGIQKATRRKTRIAGKTVVSGIPKRTKAAIMPASTAPTPAGASGKRLATMPRKKPWTTTASGTWRPKAWKEAQSTPMLAAQKPAAPSTARPPREGWAKSPSAKRKPSPPGPGPVGGPLEEAGAPLAGGKGPQPPLQVRRDQRDQDPDHDQQAGDGGGNDRQLDRALALQHPGPQQEPQYDQHQRGEGVVEGDEGAHPASDVAPPHPGFAQRPVGERDPAGAAGREEQRRRHPGHVDLVGLLPPQSQRVASHHRLEESDVGRVGDDVEGDRDADPERIRLVETAQRVAEADQLREEEVDADQQQDDDEERLQQAPRREQRHLGASLAVRRALCRHPLDATRSPGAPVGAGRG